MNNLTVFKNQNFGEVRTVTVNDEVWFVLKDVCRCLEIGNASDVNKRLETVKKLLYVARIGNAKNI